MILHFGKVNSDTDFPGGDNDTTRWPQLQPEGLTFLLGTGGILPPPTLLGLFQVLTWDPSRGAHPWPPAEQFHGWQEDVGQDFI